MPGHNSFDDEPWINRLVAFTKDVLAQDRVRIIGVCFGHQIIGRALGVTVGRSTRGWEVSVCEMDLTALGQKVFGKEKLVCLHHPTIVYACGLQLVLAYQPDA